MRKTTMPNFCINFLNKAEKSLPILYDFAVASLADAWIKIAGTIKQIHGLMSHPSRMCGLKFSSVHICQLLISSHPSRMRGLKYMCNGGYGTSHSVASLADAWIKILLVHYLYILCRVASLADAWIKIRLGTQQINHLKSHLIQMRGLKYEKLYKELINKLAASYMGVWIKCESSRI